MPHIFAQFRAMHVYSSNCQPDLNELELKAQGNKTALKQFGVKLFRRSFSKYIFYY